MNQPVILSFLPYLYQTEVISNPQMLSLSIFDEAELHDALIRQDILSAEALSQHMQQYEALDKIDVFQVGTEHIRLIPKKLLYRHCIYPFSVEGGKLHLAMANPHQPGLLETVEQIAGYAIKPYLANADHIKRVLASNLRNVQQIKNHFKRSIAEMDLLENTAGDFDDALYQHASLIKAMDALLEDAISLHVTDIHIESGEDVRIYYRMNKYLILQCSMKASLGPILMRHLLVRSRADVLKSSHPQDGAFSFQPSMSPSKTSVRLSYAPSFDGYSVVMRLFGDMQFSGLSAFSNQPELLHNLRHLLFHQSGLLAISGPTASGKTTFLYNLLHTLSHQDGHKMKVMTIEDPVEVKISGVIQMEKKDVLGLDYADIISSALRQNPDAIMLGELRDSHTANMVVRASLTGILALTTIHCKNVRDIIPRFTELGLTLRELSSVLSFLVSVRLIPVLCPFCKVKDTNPAIRRHALYPGTNPDTVFYKKHPDGCSSCDHRGFVSLESVNEHVVVDTELQQALLAGDLEKVNAIIDHRIQGKRLVDSVWSHFVQGKTTFDQVLNMTFDGEHHG